MSDNDDVPGSPDRDAEPVEDAVSSPSDDAAPTAAQPVIPAEPAAPVLKTRWRDRAWSFRAMLAVALATLLIGGLAGGTVVAAAGHDHDRHGRFMMGPGGPGRGMPPGLRSAGPVQRRRAEVAAERRPAASQLRPNGQPTAPTPSPSQ